MSTELTNSNSEPEIYVIELDKHVTYPVLCEEEGTKLRKIIDKNNLDNRDIIINVVISDDIWVLNSHFMCNFFSKSIFSLGEDNFNRKFVFTKTPINSLSDINTVEPPCEFIMERINDFLSFAFRQKLSPQVNINHQSYKTLPIGNSKGKDFGDTHRIQRNILQRNTNRTKRKR